MGPLHRPPATCNKLSMTIIEMLVRRRVSRLIISLEMISVLLICVPALAFGIARAGLDMPLPQMIIGCFATALIGIYIQALRLDEAPKDEVR